MPRQARIDAPGALHHIMARGIERRSIFRNDWDRDDFVERLAKVLTDTQTPCYAWALMPNHFHLLLKTGSVPIATVMRRTLSGYAQGFNRRHRRNGHLFQNRYKSILCQQDAYLLELVRYIHLNPLRGRIVADYKHLADYRYCGHGVLMDRFPMAFQDVETVLAMFSSPAKRAQTRYREFVRKGIAKGKRDELSGGGLVRSAGGWEAVKARRRSGLFQKADQRILGDGKFVEEVLKQADEQLEHRTKANAMGIDFDLVIHRVAQLLKMEKDDVVSASKRPVCVEARSMVCFWAHRNLGMRQTDLANRFRVSQPAICAAVRKGEMIIRENQFKLEKG
jgi:REP element-mobilizing transposase RayT